VADSGTCGCHVHVGVPSRDLGVQVLARLRPWLAPLLAVTANSPIADGRDTAWASWRYILHTRWPTATAPSVWPDAVGYDAAVRRLIAQGAALDERSILRPRPAVPALPDGRGPGRRRLPRRRHRSARGRADPRPGRDRPGRGPAGDPGASGTGPPAPRVAAALDAAARHGVAGTGVDPFTGRAADARTLCYRLLDHVSAALSDRGDTQIITTLLQRLDDRGTGADRQRALFASIASAAAFTQALARDTLSGCDQTAGARTVPHPEAGQARRPVASHQNPEPHARNLAGRRQRHGHRLDRSAAIAWNGSVCKPTYAYGSSKAPWTGSGRRAILRWVRGRALTPPAHRYPGRRP